MAEGIHVTSLRTLEDLRLALARFARDGEAALREVEREARQKLEELEDCYRESQNEVASCYEAYQSADPEEDDVSYLAYKLHQAEEHLQVVRHWRQRAEKSAGEYIRYARRLKDFAEKRSVAACAFLKNRLTELEKYIGVQPQVGSALGPPAGAAGHRPAAAGAALERVTEFALPQGFKWLRLDEINPSEIDRLPNAGDFVKVSYEQMKRGLDILLTTVLPAISRHGQKADADFFAEQDGEGGDRPAADAQNIYQSFFARDRHKHIRVERFEGDPYYDITNGRHRIKVALDSGWPAVPSEVIDVPRPRD